MGLLGKYCAVGLKVYQNYLIFLNVGVFVIYSSVRIFIETSLEKL